MRGADHLAGAMADAGVDVVFSLSGNQIMPLYDALIEPGIRIVHSRHEAAAVFMADAYAQVSGRTGVALVTAAPGFGNALGALYTAAMSESPVVLLSGDSPTSLDGQGAFQEFPQVAAAKPFVKASERVTAAVDLSAAFARAVRLAHAGRPGPVHLALPFDVLNDDAGPLLPLAADAFAPSVRQPEQAVIDAVVTRLTGYKRPLLLAGPCLSPSRGRDRLAQLAAALNLPAISLESPRGLRDPALGAFAEVLAQADGLLFIGKAVDFMSGFAGKSQSPGAEVMILDPDPAVIARAVEALGRRLVFSAEADILPAAEALAAAGSGGAVRTAWRDDVAAALACRVTAQGGGGVLAEQVGGAVQAALKGRDDAILICDGGEFGQWVQATANAATRIINGPSGAIGAALPYAIGARLARPGARIITLMGDGTAGFHLSEFETAAREETDFVAIVGNDARWNAEQVIQIRDYGKERQIGCDLSPGARYDQAAVALGCQGFHVTEADALPGTLAEALGCKGPVCIDVAIEARAAPQVSRAPAIAVKAPG
ncbi:thiamine pyrophosphate-binding protein [Pelagibius litoralis]|uniref:Thiamine pyrophosphate-binding protein n=1 Tax=Pelagibius litoralis TaxID=374515 RepID=A0A967EXN6_9PROT|nr:thiamine pyrophosphate-binding protein [Pelagibius litoralis]NIA69309.1 thiamine pyrophosphate-binding protein [Pelagibius litoralis]